MKRALIAAVCLTGAFSLGAQACPAGTHPVGGTGPHHKGGTCAANDGAGHARHAAKSSKKSHEGATSHHSKKARAPKSERTVKPEQPPMNGPANQAPAPKR